MAFIVGAAIIGGVTLLGSGLSVAASSRAAKDANALMAEGQGMSAAQYAEQLAFQKEQAALLEKQKEVYRAMEFKNPYADMTNPFEGMQNVYEDLTVATQAADFQMEQAAQQRANIMSGMRGAAGSSGIASLAQALAGQGTIQARQASVDLARQQAQNEALKAQGAMQVQQAIMKGESSIDMAARGGEAMVQEMEAQRQATLLGIEYGGMAGANAGVQAAFGNQMQMQMAGAQMNMQQAGAYAQLAGAVVSGGTQMIAGGLQGGS